MVWSCAETSARDFGRLMRWLASREGGGRVGVYYFSTQGTRRGLELVPVLLGMAFAAAFAAAALRALRSKKDMMLVVVMQLWEWKLEV